MLLIFPSVDVSLHRIAVDRQRRTSGAARNISTSRSVTSENSVNNKQVQFNLEGKPIYLQQRFSLASPIQENSYTFKKYNKTYSCSKEIIHEKKQDKKIKEKKCSAGVQKTSIKRRKEQQKPSTEVVYQQKNKRQDRSVVVKRRPLVMSTTSLPGKYLPSYFSFGETSQMFSTKEEAKATLKRLLSSRTHESMMSESVNSEISNQEEADYGGLLEKPAYLENTYDYLYNRHVQALNNVIKQQEQESYADGRELNQQKFRKQVIQLCCGEDSHQSAEDDISLNIGSGKSSTRQNSRNTSHLSEEINCSCDQSVQEDNNETNNNPNFSSSFDEENIFLTEETVGSNDNKTNSLQFTQMSNINSSDNNNLNINIVTSQINELELSETATLPKPLITFNHVSTCSESCVVSRESFQNTATLASPPRSRSPSPLLEVPFPLSDLNMEMRRPPIN